MDKGLIPVARFVDLTEAHIARGFLLTNGIEAALLDTNLVSLGLPTAQSVGGVKLMVPADDAGRASQLLREVMRGDFAGLVDEVDVREPGEDFAIERCPRCNAEDTFRPRSFVGMLFGWFFAAPMAAGTKRRHCRGCGQEWSSR